MLKPEHSCVAEGGSLRVRVLLPELESARDIELNLTSEHLHLRAPVGAANRYELQLQLPRAVHDQQGMAKFDKKARALVVTLPIATDSVPVEHSHASAAPSSSRPTTATAALASERDALRVAADRAEAEAQRHALLAAEAASTLAARRADESAATRARQDAEARERSAREAAAEAAEAEAEAAAAAAVAKAAASSAAVAAEAAESKACVAVAARAPDGGEAVGRLVEPVAPARSATAASTAEPSTQGDPAPVEWRQDSQYVALLIDVERIWKHSVSVRFEARSCSISFESAKTNQSGADDGESLRRSFELSLAGEVIPAKCRYDVADLNMMVVLHKVESSVSWPALERAGAPLSGALIMQPAAFAQADAAATPQPGEIVVAERR
tara:strand:+ start:1084 stop:2235 length:1152 start_codon:yes stop_codon:yes gene_type:complete